MKSFMDDLYFGRLVPWERGLITDPDYTLINRKISDIKMYLHDKLQPDDYAKLEEMEDLSAQSSAFEDVETFRYGLCMGMLLMMEVSDFREQWSTETK